MTQFSRIRLMSRSHFALVIFALALAGCDREQIKVQEVPKDSGQAEAPAATVSANASSLSVDPHAGMDMGMGMGGQSQPKLKYTVPSGWKEKDLGRMRVASFDAPTKEGQTNDVSVIPLAAMPASAELANLNMWRSAVGLPDADKAESQPVTIGGAQGKLYEVGGEKATGRIVVAELDRDGMSWYFKMSGSDAGVREDKPAFLDFLKSVSWEAASTPASGVAAASSAGIPAGWTEIPNPPMLTAKYIIHGSGDAQAEVNVSQLAGTGGGDLANVTRWRGQLGLAPMSEEDFSKTAQSIEVRGLKGTLVDMTGTDSKTGKQARLIGIIVPETGDTWFYKLMGDPQIVEQQKDTFTKFIQRAKFGN